MDCQRVQEEILESFDDGASAALQPEIAAHLAGCAACAVFAAKQKRLDSRMSAMLVPAAISPTFRSQLRRRIRRESAHAWLDALPDVVHFASCGVATLVCAVVLPFDPTVIVGAGTAAALSTYLVLTAARMSFEAVE